MTAPTLRADLPLDSQLTAIARADGLSLTAYLERFVRADPTRRQRLAHAVGLRWSATVTEVADRVAAAVATPLSDIEQHYLPTASPDRAIMYAVSRAAKKPRQASASKPSPAPTLPKETERQELERYRREAARGPNAWRASVKASLAKGRAVRITGQTLQLRVAQADSLPAEFRLFIKGANDSTKGAVLFDSRAAELVMAQAKRHGVDFM